MVVKSIKNKMTAFFKRYKYAALILAVGLILMILPSNKNKTEKQEPIVQTEQVQPSMNEILANTLSQVDGAGEVRVLLSIAAGAETVYQTDEATSISDASSSTQIDTVVISDSSRGQQGIIRQVNPPTYLGAIVVCTGADSPTVRLAIIDAVSKITGLRTNQISILKMK